MVFSDTATFQGILQHTNFLCGLPPSDATQYPTADKTRNTNANYRTVLGWIWKVQGNWTFDDTNLTDLPYFRSDVVTGQEDYTLPTNYGIVERIEIKDQAGIWYRIYSRTDTEIRTGLEEYQKSNSIPREVKMFANSYRLYPAANWTSSDGDSLRVYCTRDIDAFTTADTTQEPGFNKNWHHILPVMNTKDWAIRNELGALYTTMQNEETKIRAEIENYYASRNNLEQEKFKPRNRQGHAR